MVDFVNGYCFIYQNIVRSLLQVFVFNIFIMLCLSCVFFRFPECLCSNMIS